MATPLIEMCILLTVFTLQIWLFVRKNRLGGIHWYPKEVQQEAIKRRLVTENYIVRRNRLTRLVGLPIMAIIVLGSVFYINEARTWWTAAWQIYLMLFVLNLFDAIVVDYLWVRKTNYWLIPELADLEIAKPLNYLLKERAIAVLAYLPLSALFGCITFLL